MAVCEGKGKYYHCNINYKNRLKAARHIRLSFYILAESRRTCSIGGRHPLPLTWTAVTPLNKL